MARPRAHRPNANYLILTLKTTEGTLFELLRRMDLEPAHDGHGNITVGVKGPDDIQTILAAMKDAGASPLSLDVRKPNLEAVFLKLTGEALRD